MPFLTDTFARSSFKLLQGLGHTANAKDPANESEPSTIAGIAVVDVFGETIDTSPSQAVFNGIASFVTLDLALDPSSNGKAYFAEINTVAGTSLDGYINPRTGLNYTDGDRVGYLIPPKFGIGYRAILKDLGVEVPPLTSEDWFFDYRAGIITSEDNLGLTTGTLDGYVFVGRLLSDRFDGNSLAADLNEDGYLNWQRIGNNVQNLNSGDITISPGNVSVLSGTIGIGVAASTVPITVSHTGPTAAVLINTDTPSSSEGSTLILRHTDGSTAMGSDHRLGRMLFSGFDGTAVFDSAAIESQSTATWSVGSNPSRLIFQTTDTTGGLTERMRITEDGSVGIGVTTPSLFSLQVDGDIGPDADLSYDLGSLTNRWANLFVGNVDFSELVLQNSTSTTDGAIRWNDANMQRFDGYQWKNLDDDISFVSVTTNSSSDPFEDPFNPFRSDSFSAFVENTDWQYNGSGGGVEYRPEDGYFIVNQTASYKLDFIASINADITSQINLSFIKNNIVIHNGVASIFSTTDPQERTLSIVEDLEVGDILECRLESTTGGSNINTVSGTTFTVQAVALTHSSTSLILTGTASSAEINLFDENDSGGAVGFVKGTDWDHNARPQNVTFDQTDGTFTIERTGTYKINAAIYMLTGASQLVTIRLKKNGSIFYTVAPSINASLDPLERSVSVIENFTTGDTLSITVEGATTTITPHIGTTLNVYKVNQEQISITTLSNSDAISAEYNIFEATNYSAFVEGVDWDQNADPFDVTFAATTGRFFAKKPGPYKVDVVFFYEQSASDTTTIFVKKNGAIIYTQNSFASFIVDPVERSVVLVVDMITGDYIEVTADPGGAATLTTQAGTTFNMHRIGPEDAQSGQWSQAGEGTNLYFENGSVGIGTPLPDVPLHIRSRTADPMVRAEKVTDSIFIQASPLAIKHRSTGSISSNFAVGLDFETEDVTGINNIVGRILLNTQTVENSASMRFLTANAGSLNTNMYISEVGDVGIGTQLPDSKLHIVEGSAGSVVGQTNSPLVVENSTDSFINILSPAANEGGIFFGSPTSNVRGGVVYDHNTDDLEFRTGGNVTGATIDVSGNLGVGVIAPSARLEVRNNVTNIMRLFNTAASSSTAGAFISLGSDDNAVLGAGHRIGAISWFGTTAADTYVDAATIEAFAVTAHSVSNTDSRMQFKTTPTGSTSPVTRMTIGNDGNVMIGSNVSPDTNLHLDHPGNAIVTNDVDISEVGFKIHNTTNTNGLAVGLGFAQTASASSLGAAIIHERTGANSQGQLHFATKSDTVASTDIPIHMTIAANGFVGIGTTVPDTLLHLSADGSVTPATLRFEDTDTSAAGDQIVGSIEWETRDATDAGVAARIDGIQSGSGDIELQFLTGDASSIEHSMTIGAFGGVGITTGVVSPVVTGGHGLTVGSATGDRGSIRIAADTSPGTPNRLQGRLLLEEFTGSDQYLWATDAGVLRIGTTSPTESTDTSTGTVVGTQTFTGFHFYQTEAIIDEYNDDGYEGYLAIGDAVAIIDGYITRTSFNQQKNVVGLFCGFTIEYADSLTGERTVFDVYYDEVDGYYDGYDAYRNGVLYKAGVPVTRAIIASLGDVRDFDICNTLRGFSICDEGGAVVSGDLLCSSSVYGYLMKQSDDIMHSYTVGKALEDVTFDGEGKATQVYGYIYCG